MTTQIRKANLFDLSGGDTTIHYAASSISGVPLFGYEKGDQKLSFRGDEIGVDESSIGTAVTVTIATVPDLHSVTVTVLLPEVNVEGSESALSTFAVVTTHRSSIGGPALVRGQVQSYEVVPLIGIAKAVDF